MPLLIFSEETGYDEHRAKSTELRGKNSNADDVDFSGFARI